MLGTLINTSWSVLVAESITRVADTTTEQCRIVMTAKEKEIEDAVRCERLKRREGVEVEDGMRQWIKRLKPLKIYIRLLLMKKK